MAGVFFDPEQTPMSTQDITIFPPPQFQITRPIEDKWRREYEAFQRLRPGLLATHAGQYVLIHNEQVLATGKDDLELALRFFAQYGNVPVHIGLVTSEPDPVVRIPHYRIINPSNPS